MASEVVVVGSLNADLVLSVERFPAPGETMAAQRFAVFPGGKGGNQAFGAAKLGASVSMLGQVGADQYGAWLTAQLASGGVDVNGIAVDERHPSGTALITVDAAGQNQIIIVGGANASFTPERLASQRARFAGARVLLLQLEIPLETVMAAAALARAEGALVVLDPAPARALPDALLGDVDYLTPNESELCTLTGGANGRVLDLEEVERRARLLLAAGARKVLVKLAERGSLLVSAGGAQRIPALGVTAVDTTAAGDAFNAGLSYALAAGMGEKQAIELASSAGAFSVTRRGAQPSMPTLPELLTLRAQHEPVSL
jgi:ribokinase